MFFFVSEEKVEGRRSKRLKPILLTVSEMIEGGQYFREIDASGKTSSFGKSLRALQGYIETITAEIDRAVADDDPESREGKEGSGGMSRAKNASKMGGERSVNHDLNRPNSVFNVLENIPQTVIQNVPRPPRTAEEQRLAEYIVAKENHALNLRIRDLRLLDVNFYPADVYSIIVKKHAVVLSLDPFKAVVMADRLIVIIPQEHTAEENMDVILKMFESRFKGL